MVVVVHTVREDACALGGKLVSRWRNLLGQGGNGIQAGSEHQCAQGHGYGWRLMKILQLLQTLGYEVFLLL